MADKDYILRFFHKGHFSKTEYLGGRCDEIPEYVESDKFSYTVVMEYVKDLKYTEIGGVYVKNMPSGWKLIDNDRDLQDFVSTVEGERLDFYVDHIIDKNYEPQSQMQPHVIVRPRTKFFEALQAKRKFVTIEGLQKQRVKRQSTRGKATTDQPETETRQVLPKVTEYEKNRRLLVAENKKKIDELGLKQLAAGLNVKNVNEKVQADDEPEFDREYVPGHDSLSEAEKEDEDIVVEQPTQKQKKAKTVTNPISRPITRSRTTAPLSKQSEPANNSSPVISSNLPPPPPLPNDSSGDLPLQVAPAKRYNNQGIGSMEAYVLMKDRQKTLEKEKNKVDDGGQTSHSETNAEIVETSTAAPKDYKRRGPTRMNDVYTRKPEEKKVIKLNCELQAVADNDKDLSEFKNFLGTLGRQSVPLDLVNWHKFPAEQKESLWNFVKTKYDIPEEGRTYTLRTIGALWRLHKSRIKKDHYLKYDNDEDRLKNRPPVISNEEFKVLLKYWGDEEVQDRAKKNAENRKLIVETHTAGRKSFAQIGEKIKAEKNIEPEKLAPKDDIYDKTRKRKPGHEYKTATVVKDGNGEEQVKQPKHGPNWLLGRSGKCRKMMKAQQPKLFTSSSTPDIDDLKKSLREEIMAEMQEMIDRKVSEKMSKVIAKLGEINPDFKHLDVEELCLASGDESEDNDQEHEEEHNEENEEELDQEQEDDRDD